MKNIRQINNLKIYTDVYSKQPNGTIHSFNYKKENDKWLYEITFHHEEKFAPIVFEEPKQIDNGQAILKARGIYDNTIYVC